MAEGPFGGPRPFAEPEGWRAPNDEEIAMLKEKLDNGERITKNSLEQNRIAVKNKYVSDMPGYAGSVIIVLGGEPEFLRMFGKDNDTGELIEFEVEPVTK